MKTIVIGATGSGKTTLVKKFVGGGGLFLDNTMLKSDQHCRFMLSSYLQISGHEQIVLDDIYLDDEHAFQRMLNNNDSVIVTFDTIHTIQAFEDFDVVWVLTVLPPYARLLRIPHRGDLPFGHGFVAKREDNYHWRPFTHHGDIVVGDVTQHKLDEAISISPYIYPSSRL